MNEGYQTFDHTGDLGLEVWAATPERLFALAAVALSAQIAEAGDEPQAHIEVRIAGDDARDLLVHWLNTSLLHASLERAVWTRATVRLEDSESLEGMLEGPRLDPLRHVLLREVKAVSHHDLSLVIEPRHCRCRLVLDI